MLQAWQASMQEGRKADKQYLRAWGNVFNKLMHMVGDEGNILCHCERGFHRGSMLFSISGASGGQTSRQAGKQASSTQ